MTELQKLHKLERDLLDVISKLDGINASQVMDGRPSIRDQIGYANSKLSRAYADVRIRIRDILDVMNERA